ncbi:MFS transporter [Agromyces bracchium]|uniref:MFS transporter n=1 Tax=Agromyces bracchium TaxID=88376 RepID=A0A6I3MBD1_9MICO|nr:MFS transporter [Agromyces bracchium]MTH69287.1 MFS transporter [Agromyces bracchium]
MTTGSTPTAWPPPGGWLWRPLVGATLSQVVLGIVRPTASYAAIDLGADGVMVGVIAAAFAILPMLLAVPVGRVSGRLGRLGIIPGASAIVLVAACALGALAHDLATLAVAGALLGAGNLGVLLGAQSWISRSAPSSRYNDGFGWMTAGMALGQAVGPLVAGLVIGPVEVTSDGIAAAFWSAAAVSAGLGLVFLSRATRAYAPGAAAEVGTLEILRRPGVARYLVVSAAVLTTVDILTAYLPVLGSAVGIPPVLIGAMLALRGVTSTLSRLLLGPLSRRWSESGLIVASTLGAAICVALIALAPTTIVLFAALGVGGFFLGMGQPLTMTAVAIALPARARSSGLALRLLGNRVAQTATPLLAAMVTAAAGVAAIFILQVAGLLVSAAWESFAARRGPDDYDRA